MTAFAAGFALGALLVGGLCVFCERRRQKILGRYLAFSAHELNTPITSVNMTVLNLLEGVMGEIPLDQRPWFEMMREQLVRLVAMSGDLRDFIHQELLKDIILRKEDVSIKEALEQAVAAIAHGAAQAQIALDVKIPPDLPSGRADANCLPRILTSVLFHARRFRTEGPLTVAASPAQDGRVVQIEVGYSGPKLSPEEARQSLELYFPARQRRDQNLTATGLGIGLLKNLLEAQGAEMDFAVASDGKSLLRIRIPLASSAGG